MKETIAKVIGSVLLLSIARFLLDPYVNTNEVIGAYLILCAAKI